MEHLRHAAELCREKIEKAVEIKKRGYTWNQTARILKKEGVTNRFGKGFSPKTLANYAQHLNISPGFTTELKGIRRKRKTRVPGEQVAIDQGYNRAVATKIINSNLESDLKLELIKDYL